MPGYTLGKFILGDMDFDQGNWTMVGVSTYNYRPLSIQEDLKTFKLTDSHTLNMMKKQWNVVPFYQDNCEYHYVLKFYKEKKLIKTFKINLYCNYITEDVFSYTFDPIWLTQRRNFYQNISWTKYSFSNLPSLRKAITKAENSNDVFLYHDIRPYLYDGYFIAKSKNLKWDINRDSVINILRSKIELQTGSKEFHIVPYLFYINETWEINFRFVVYCNEKIGKKFKSADITADWRHHFGFNENKDVTIELVVVGADKKFFEE